MATRTAQANERTYTLGVDDPVPLARRLWASVQARVVDELTGAPPQSRVRLETPARGFAPRVAEGGLVGFVARPIEVFPALNVAGQGYDVPFSVHAAGFLPYAATATLSSDPLFPGQFEPFVFVADLALHREPVVLAGRVIRRVSGVLTPVAGATVAVTGLWTMLPPAAVDPPPDPPNLVSLAPPLYAARPATAGRLRRREMTPVAGEDKTLMAWAGAGDLHLPLSDGVNLSVGDVLLIDADPAVREYIAIDAVMTSGAASLPATVTLAHPLAYAHRPGTLAHRVVPQAPGPARPLSRDAIAADPCLFLDSLGGLGGVEVVEVFGGSPPVPAAEFHRLHLFTTQSDPDGRYRLPPLSRVARLEVKATEGGDTSGPVTFVPNYLIRENALELVLS